MKNEDCTVVTCPRCGYVIKEWGILSCPRCKTSLLELRKCNGDCHNCSVKGRG
jgi:hypothetical protein